MSSFPYISYAYPATFNCLFENLDFLNQSFALPQMRQEGAIDVYTEKNKEIERVLDQDATVVSAQNNEDSTDITAKVNEIVEVNRDAPKRPYNRSKVGQKGAIKRNRKNKLQMEVLAPYKDVCEQITRDQIKEIAESVNLNPVQVYKWFWDQKNKAKKAGVVPAQ